MLTNTTLITYFARLLVLFTTLPIHEYAHGWVADKLGDPTARRLGRLDLNPLVHLDLMGSLLILLTGFGWAKPVPVNASNFKRQYTMRGGFALTALAGPMANILLALVVMVFYKIIGVIAIAAGTAAAPILVLLQILNLMISINLGLAVFNLLPIPPLDGYSVLAYFLPTKALVYVENHRQAFFIGLMALVWLTEIVSGIVGLISGLLYQGLHWATYFIDLLARLII